MTMFVFESHSVSPPLLRSCTFYGMMVDSDTDKHGIQNAPLIKVRNSKKK